MDNIPQTRAKTKGWVAFVAIVGFNNLALFYVRVSDPLELQTVMSCSVAAGNQTWVLWNSGQCS